MRREHLKRHASQNPGAAQTPVAHDDNVVVVKTAQSA
jgi:hypothetical protein